MLRQCCQCKKIWVDGHWVHARYSQLVDQEISHGYCDGCYAEAMRQIRRNQRRTCKWFRRLVPWVH